VSGVDEIAVVDDEFARLAEGTLGQDLRIFVEGMRQQDPGGNAHSERIADGWLHFSGPHHFGNRAQGLGLEGPVRDDELDSIAAFYEPLGLPAEVEVCPHAHHTLLEGLVARSFLPIGFRNVYLQDRIHPNRTTPLDEAISTVSSDQFEAWNEVVLDGFGYDDSGDRRRVGQWNRMLLERPEVILVLAYDNEKGEGERSPVGAANVVLHGVVASLGGTTTLPAFRDRGVQLRLLKARLAIAAGHGCTTAIVTADPGGGSSRNVQRAGFRLAYTNVRLRRPLPVLPPEAVTAGKAASDGPAARGGPSTFVSGSLS
jgi:GNAT superfamily N-acetyltransferase